MVNQINDVFEEQIYYLAAEIRKGIENLTGQGITEWGSEFQLISEISYFYLSGVLNWDCFTLSDIHPDLTETQAQEILNRAAEHLGYA